MNSDIETLRSRGYIENYDYSEFVTLERDELVCLLQDKEPVKRSIAAKVISTKFCMDDVEITNILLEQLSKERKLYTRLEICSSLEQGEEITAREMVRYLGKIGKNQHKVLPKRPSLKVSYPLPRDMIAGSLARMNTKIMPVLLEVLESDDEHKISEVLDAIGFMAFYDRKAVTNETLDQVLVVLEKYKSKDIITWKGIISLSGFPLQKSVEYLNKIVKETNNELFLGEAKRALEVMKGALFIKRNAGEEKKRST